MIKKLKEVMPIDRAKMKLRITTDDDAAPLKAALGELRVNSFESEGSAGNGGGGEVLDFLVDPGMYRDVEEAVRTVAGYVRACSISKKSFVPSRVFVDYISKYDIGLIWMACGWRRSTREVNSFSLQSFGRTSSRILFALP